MAYTQKDEWVEAKDAAEILSRKSGHKIGLPYVRQLTLKGHVRSKAKDGRTNLYYKPDLDAYPPVRKKTERKAEQHQEAGSC
jgi:hypothetical protein